MYGWISCTKKPLPMEPVAIAAGSEIVQKFRTVYLRGLQTSNGSGKRLSSPTFAFSTATACFNRHWVLLHTILDIYVEHQSEAPHVVHLAKRFESPVMM